MRLKVSDIFDSFYFIGIGGVSMSGLAKYFLSLGKKVAGSDIAANEYTAELENLGVEINYGDNTENISEYGLIVYTDAIRDNDVRLMEARRLDKPIMARGTLLHEVGREFKKVIAVSGCHGKTTCAAMLAHIFSAAGKKFASHIGGKDATLSNFYICGRDFFITEACEYKKNFLRLKPDIAVILNSDSDHLECYGDESALKKAYMEFAKRAAVTVSLYKDLPFDFGRTFGFDKYSDYYAKNMKLINGAYSFELYEDAKEEAFISLAVYGRHNVLNALAAAATARCAGIPFKFIKEGLASFSGVVRRFENIGEVNGARCVADYAHHPNEIRATVRTAQKLTDGRLFVVFQPHTYSRTKNLFDSFVKALSPLNNLLIYRTYAAREYLDDAGSALTLSQSVKKSHYGDKPEDIKEFIKKAGKGDVILFLGAGDIYYIAKKLMENPPVDI